MSADGRDVNLEVSVSSSEFQDLGAKGWCATVTAWWWSA